MRTNDLFIENTVAQVAKIVAQNKQEIEEKKQQLRKLVG